ncbi:MAG: lytic transglycosylase domain-containing protein [Nitrospinota bacterium]
MLDLNFIEQLQSAMGSSPKSQKEKLSSDRFYSLLIKHQLNMMDAWNPSKPDSSTGSGNLAETLLNLKKISNFSAIPGKLKTQKVLQSYQQASISKAGFSDVDSLTELANRVAKKHNVPESLFQKLIQTESSFNPKAKSPRGAMGLGQLMPGTAEELGLSLKEEPSIGSVWHPESNLDASARYLRKLYDKYTGQGISPDEAWSFAAGAYNAGMGNIGRAMEKAGTVEKWDQVAAVLPQITGKHSSETIRYVNRLRA